EAPRPIVAVSPLGSNEAIADPAEEALRELLPDEELPAVRAALARVEERLPGLRCGERASRGEVLRHRREACRLSGELLEDPVVDPGEVVRRVGKAEVRIAEDGRQVLCVRSLVVLAVGGLEEELLRDLVANGQPRLTHGLVPQIAALLRAFLRRELLVAAD